MLLAIALLCVYSTCKSQISRIGIRTSGNVYFLEIHNPKSKIGYYKSSPLYESYSVGITYERRIVKKLFFKPELIYTKSHGVSNFAVNQKGDTSVFYNYTSINQITTPLLLRINLNKIYLLGGPSVSFIINESNLIQRRVDAGINIGFGVDLPDINPTLSIDLRYYRGFLNVNDIGYIQSYLQLGISLLLTTK